MRADVLAEASQGAVVLLGVVGRGQVEERRERRLGVDRDGPPAREGDDQVGAQPAVVDADLLGEVAVVDESGELDGAAQVELAPLPADLRLAQRRGEGGGLAAQGVGGVAHVGHLLVELGLPRDPVVGEVAELVLEPVEAVAHDGLVGRALLEGREGGVVGGACA